MKIYEIATAAIVAAALYWVIVDWVKPKTCDYLFPVENMTVRYTTKCGLSEDEAFLEFMSMGNKA